MTTNLFVIANVKQLRTGGSFRILLPFFRTSWGVGFLNSVIFNSFHSRVEFGTILEGLRNFGGGGRLRTNPPSKPPRYATAAAHDTVGAQCFFNAFSHPLHSRCSFTVIFISNTAVFLFATLNM